MKFIIQHDIGIIIHLAPKRGLLTHGGDSVHFQAIFKIIFSPADSPVNLQ